MYQGLADTVAVVTGAGSVDGGVGIGAAIAITLSRGGVRVAVVDLAADRAQRTVDAITAEGGTATPVLADITDDEQGRRAIEQVTARWGRLDTLVNSVGIVGGAGPLDALELATWDRVVDTNLRSAVIMCRHAVEHLRASDHASIVNISSVGGLQAIGNVAYGPSKAALIQLTRELALLYGPSGIRSNAIAPGHLYTPLLGDLTAAERERRRRVAPLGIEGNAWDVANVAVFLASDNAGFVNGICIPVDGGVTSLAALAAARLLDD